MTQQIHLGQLHVGPLHLGALHPVEQALTLLLAFGPFAVLAVVIVLRRRAEERQHDQYQGDQRER